MDLESNSFTLATAFETIYFWPDLEIAFKNILKALKPGGVFMRRRTAGYVY